MKKTTLLYLLLPLLLVTSCSESGEDTSGSETAKFCEKQSVEGSLSGFTYVVPEIKEGASLEIQKDKPVTDGVVTYSLSSSCSEEGVFQSLEILSATNCEGDFEFNPLAIACEDKAFYSSSHLNPEGLLDLLELRNPFVESAGTSYKVLKAGVEIFSSDTLTEVADGKIKESVDFPGKIELLSKDVFVGLEQDDEICFEVGSENKNHCYFYNKPEASTVVAVEGGLDVSEVEVGLLNAEEQSLLNDTGTQQNQTVLALDERKESNSTEYLELNHQAVYFDLDFNLKSENLYQLSLEINSEDVDSELTVLLYRKSEFDPLSYQKKYLKIFNFVTTDTSLQRKKVTIDFVATAHQNAEELVALVYGKNKILVKDFKLSKVESSTAKDFSLFLTHNPDRVGSNSHHVPAKFVPFGMLGAFGYGTYSIDSNLEKYETYVSYEDEFKTTQAHLYEKYGTSDDALLSWNFRGANDSAPGGDSTDFLHGTLFQGAEWPTVKDNASDYTVILHAEGGSFAVDGSNNLIPYNSFSHETSVGGVTETGLRFNNRVPRTLGSLVLRADNEHDPAADPFDPASPSNQHSSYYPDIYGNVYVEDDGFGNPQITGQGNALGYDLTTPYLFYLHDDQGAEWDSGGPEGALAGVLHEQETFSDFLDQYSLNSGEDEDSDGASNYVEYVTGTNPSLAVEVADLSSSDLFIEIDFILYTFKRVLIPISKYAKNFNITVYEKLHNGVERAVWSFDRGRGLKSPEIYSVIEGEHDFSIELLSTLTTDDVADLRVEIN